MDEFQFGSQTVSFDFHKAGFNGPSYVAACVKHYQYPKLPKKYQHKLDRLEELQGLKRSEQIQRWAFENTRENWWEWAEETAKEMLPGNVLLSAGRSGGWLAIDHEKKEDIEDDAKQYSLCVCGYRYSEHIGDKCPFDTTNFESEAPECLRHVQRIRAFLDVIEASIKTVHLDYLHELKYQIDQAWEQHRADAKQALHERRARKALEAFAAAVP